MIDKSDIKFVLTFLKAQFDELKTAFKGETKVSVDLGDAGASFKEAADQMKKVVSEFDKRENKKDLGSDSMIRSEAHLIQSVKEMKGLGRTLEAILNKKDPGIPQEVRDTLSQISTSLKNFKPEKAEKFDYKPLTRVGDLLVKVHEELKKDKNKELIGAMENVLMATSKLEKAITEAKTMKLDDQQIKILTSGFGGGAVDHMARSMTMKNLSMASANTEYSYTFPANTVSWVVKLRSQNTLLLYAFATGKLPTSGDGSAYATVPQNFLQSKDNVEWSGKTIYLQTGSASQVAEIISYQL